MSGLTSSPAAALMPGSRLLVGVERDDEGLRLYVDARYTGLHTHLPMGDVADQVQGAWDCNTSRHLWLTDVPIDALCDCTTVRTGA